ncbi:MAG: coproporphyrinogen dehydrogenase HemZ [Christensenella sp.]
MFSVYTDMPAYFNDICDEIRLFLPEEKHIEQLNTSELINVGGMLRHLFWCENNTWHNSVEYYVDGVLAASKEETPDFTDKNGNAADVNDDTLSAKKLKKHAAKCLIYDVLQQYHKKSMPWGSLTGIRPTKLLRDIIKTHGAEEAHEIFVKTYHVSEAKTQLAEAICAVQKPFINNTDGQAIDIYIGIPFCVSRCKYCSFISRDLKFNETIKEQYLPCLLHEMDAMHESVNKYNLRAVYIGGGTPTALCEKDLEAVLKKTNELFGNRIEFTVEAGRPDTVTNAKLKLLKEYGVKRISINAQTTNDATLERIGRKHTAAEFADAFARAKQMDFESINTDIILGLPNETVKDVENTLADLMQFEPDNVTVHTLALKNSSEFALETQNDLPNAAEVSRMVEYSQHFLSEAGYLPYYLYRQKYMSGNLENVGFTKPGKECIYNIDVMEETVSNLAFGAGGISKRLFPEINLIKRAPNVKDLKNYIERTDEMIARKKDLF